MAAWWEYKIVYWVSYQKDDLEDEMNKWGRDGWELTGIVEGFANAHQREGYAIFKRQRPEGG